MVMLVSSQKAVCPKCKSKYTIFMRPSSTGAIEELCINCVMDMRMRGVPIEWPEQLLLFK